MEYNTADIINLSVGITSLILAVLAGGLSIYFFIQAKKAEQGTAQLLEGIKVQTEALQKLTGKWMDKLINYSTQSQPVYSETLTTLMTFIHEIPSKISNALPPASGMDESRKEMVVGYIGTYYYAAMANVALQDHVPTEFDVTNETHNLIKTVIDSTYNDVNTFKRLLEGLGQELIQNRAYNFYQSTENNWLILVKDFDQVYREKRGLGQE